MRSKIILGGFLALSLFGAACDKYKSTSLNQNTDVQSSSSVGFDSYPSVTTTTPPTSGIGAGLGIISTPKPFSPFDESPPKEPGAYKTASPYIIGKSAGAFNGNNGVLASVSPTVIVPGKLSGQVFGYDPTTKSYKVLSNSTVSLSGSVLSTDSSGNYTTAGIINDVSDISASAPGYYASTVVGVTPGENRNIHLQPLDSTPVFNQNTITADILTLSAAEPQSSDTVASATPVPAAAGSATPFPAVDYPSVLAFGDNNNSRFATTLIDSKKGRIRVEVNPAANQTTAKGQLFIYNLERDSSGKPTNPTQIQKFIYKKDITFRVGDTQFPGISSSTAPTTTVVKDQAATDAANALKNFININVKFHDSYGFSNFTCNAYVVFPTGEKVLASKYVGGTPTELSFRLPKITDINNLSYAIEAHAGNSSLGSDVAVKDLHEGDSVEAYLLQPPTGLTPNYESTGVGNTPTFSWTGVSDAKAYQADVHNTDLRVDSAWEGFTTATSIKYPSGINSLISNSQYSFQVVSLDFNYGGFHALSNRADELSLRAVRTGNKDLPFKIKLNTEDVKTLPKGYRVSYNTVLFRAK